MNKTKFVRTVFISLFLVVLITAVFPENVRAMSFDTAVNYDVEKTPYSVTAGDFNRDGNPDLAVANYTDDTVSILTGNGNGTFIAAVNYAAGDGPTSVTAADFNRDGNPDLAVANRNTNKVSILTGNGNGTFNAAVNYGAGAFPISVTAGDFNRDGKPDLAVANNNGNDVSVLLNNTSPEIEASGNVTFNAAVNYPAGNTPFSVIAGDFNRDGKADLAVANGVGNTISILTGNGNGTFNAAVNYDVGAFPYSVTAGDFNRDGKPDLAVANNNDDTVSILTGNGNGTFNAAVNYDVGAFPYSVTAGDFNRDGKADLAVANGDDDTVSILTGNGNGTFIAAGSCATGALPWSVTAGDFNRDGKPDLAVANSNGNNVSVLLNTSPEIGAAGDGTFNAVESCATEDGPMSVITADFNRDGNPDLAVANYLGSTISILTGKGDGTFNDAVNYPAGAWPRSVITADFNRDGKPDLAVTNDGGNVSVLLNNTSPEIEASGNVTFNAAVNYATGALPYSVTAGDFNRDGNPDLAVANYDDDNVSILTGNGNGTFIAAESCATGDGPWSVTAGDFNRDGNPDLAVANRNTNKVSILTGNGNGTFNAAVPYPAGAGPRSVITADFNRDGNPDLAVTNDGGTTISILTGNGNGTFNAAVPYPAGAGPRSVTADDFNRDGNPDLAVANYNDGNVSILTGNGNGTFNAAVNYGAGAFPISVTAGDFNRDGKPDLAVANNTGNNVSVLLNTSPEIDVSGNGVTIADGDVTPSAADHTDFGNADITTGSMAHTFTITNSGDGVLNLSGTPVISLAGDTTEFTVTDSPAVAIAIGGSDTFTITFDPTSTGVKTATISIANNDADENPYSFTIQGTGTVAPEMNLKEGVNNIADGGAYDYGNHLINTGTDIIFTIENTGTGDLTLTTPIAIGGANADQFSIRGQPVSPVAVGNTTTFTVRFSPTSIGAKTATISIANNDADENPYDLTIQGTGTTPEMDIQYSGTSITNGDNTPSSEKGTYYGNTDVSTGSVVRTFTIINTGSGALNLSGVSPYISITGDDAENFSVTGIPSSSVTASGSTTFEITFNPVTGGLKNATIFIVNNDADENPYTFTIQGIGVDYNGNLTAAGGVTEPVGLDTTVDTTGEAVNVFDFTLSDGGGDGLALTASQVDIHVSGTSTNAERGKVTWRLNGPGAANVTGTYNDGSDTLTFSGLAVSIADGGSELYTINGFYNNTAGLTEDHTFILSVDGDTDLTIGTSGTQMGTTSPVTNGTGTTIDVVATQLVFTTQPAGSVSGVALTTQPVVAAQDAFGNTDVDFAETVTLTEASAGDLDNNTKAAIAGVATFTDLTYTATADQQAFTLTANDEDGTGSNLPTTDANAVTSDVVATKLLFQTQPAPLTGLTGVEIDLATAPEVRAVDANDVTDTGYGTAITLAEVNGTGSATMSATGDTDGSASTVTITPVAGVATFTDLCITYTNSSATTDETFNLRASSGGLTTADSSQFTSRGLPAITSAAYDADTGILTVTGTNFQANSGGADIDASKFSITAEGETHALSTTNSVEITSSMEFTLAITGVDKITLATLINRNGTASTNGVAYNLDAADDWCTNVTGGNTADATNAITVTSVPAPVITGATYHYSNNQLILTGTGFLRSAGAANDIDVSTLAVTGEGGTYTLNTSFDVEIISGSLVYIGLSGADATNIKALLNKNGTSAESGTTFNLAAGENWNAGADPLVDIADDTIPLTVTNFANPVITEATYNWLSGQLTVIGTNFVPRSGSANDVDASLLTIRGGDSETYTLTDSSDVEITSVIHFTITLSTDDKLNVNGILNKNGGTSGSGTAYNLEAEDNWMTGSPEVNNITDTSDNSIDVSNVQTPTITSATYDAGSGLLTVTGTNMSRKPGNGNDIDASKFTVTAEGETYTLTAATSDVEITNGTTFTLTVAGADKTALDLIINKNGQKSTNGVIYNLEAADNWARSAPDAADPTNVINVSGVVAPAITDAAYNFTTGVLTVTGTSFTRSDGVTNDIDASLFTFTGEGGGTCILTNTADVEIDTATQFTLTLSPTDRGKVNSLLNKDGAASTGGTTYNLAAADNWAKGTDASLAIADDTNVITVSGVIAPTITSATYDWATGNLVVTGTDFVYANGATNDIDASLITIKGGDNMTYTLTTTPDVEITSATSFTLILSDADKINVHGLLNKNGLTSGNGTAYDITAADDWMPGSGFAGSIADDGLNAITVSNVQTPTITSATYDSDTGVLTVTGTNMSRKPGENNDIDVSCFTVTGEGGSYTISNAITDVEITSDTGFSFTVTGADKTQVDSKLDLFGTQSSGGTTYNLAAADNWLAAADPAENIADAGPNGITVIVMPRITSATYNAVTGIMIVTGANIQANDGAADIDASKFTITGEGADTYTLTDTPNGNRNSITQFTLTLSATDWNAVAMILNKNGDTSTGGTAYNISAADNWCTNVTEGDSSDTGPNAITASNVPAPAVTSATYDAATGALVVTGTRFTHREGAGNDVDATRFTFTAEGGETYTLTDATSDVEITNGTTFTLIIAGADKTALDLIINKIGDESTNGVLYNLAAAEDWARGADAAVVIADDTNAINVSNVPLPAITSATYFTSNGILTVTGTGFTHRDGAGNDIDASLLTFRGEGAATYTLTDTADADITSGTVFVLPLSAADKAAVNLLLNQNGTKSIDNTNYNLHAAEDWARGPDAAVNIVDSTTPITVSTGPEIGVTADGTGVADGDTYDFGSKTTNSNTDVEFVILNTGDANLTFTAPIVIGGANADQFSVQVQPVSPVAPAGNTTFTIRFTPTGAGAKTATISITNNDGDENPYDITLNGTGTIPAPPSPPPPAPTPTPTLTPTTEPEERPIAEIDTQHETTAQDTRGNSLVVTGGLITVSGQDETLRVNIPVALGEGATLGSFTDAAGLRFENNRLEIPTSSVTGTGKSLLQIEDENGDLGTKLIIETREVTGNGNSASAEVQSIKSTAGFTGKDFSNEDQALGEVSSKVNLDLETLPQDAKVKITTSRQADPEADSAFQLAAADAGMGSISVAYTINVEKTNLSNGTDIQSAAITMIAGREWVEANGGIDAIRIIRYDNETGTSQLLETIFLGYDDEGRAMFEGLSPDGLSVFALAGKKPSDTNIKPEVTPTTTPTPTAPTEPQYTGTPTTTSAPVEDDGQGSSYWWILWVVLGLAVVTFTIVYYVKNKGIDQVFNNGNS